MASERQNFVVPVNGFNGVANSANGAVLELPRGPLYKRISVFTTVAGALADPTTVASKLRLKMGAVTLRDVSPAQLINYSKLYGVTPVTGEIPIPFTRPWLTNKALAEETAWDTYGQPGKFTMEMDFLNPGGGAVGIQSVDTEQAPGRNVRIDRRKGSPTFGKPVAFLNIHKMKQETAIATGASTPSITTIDRSRPIKALLFDVSANAISDLEIIADGVQIFKMSRTRYNAILAQHKLDGTQFAFAWVADYDGSRHSLRCSSLEVKPTVTGACNITILNIQQANAYV